MRDHRSVVAFAAALWMFACAAVDQPHDEGPISIASLNPVLVVGLDEQDSLTSFTRVQDAAFVGEGIAVLDLSPPFLRVFDQSGRLTASLVPEGKGPGEARRPSGVAPFDSGYLVTEIGRVSHIDASGRLLSSFAAPGQRVRGAVVSCEDEALLLTTPVAEVDGPGAILRYRRGAEAAETLMTIDSVRANSREVHPMFGTRESGVVSLYPEDVKAAADFSCMTAQEAKSPSSRSIAWVARSGGRSASLAGTCFIPRKRLGRPEWRSLMAISYGRYRTLGGTDRLRIRSPVWPRTRLKE